MPIMDGYEASIRIFDRVNNLEKLIPFGEPDRQAEMKKPNRTLIYSLTSDFSHLTRQKLADYPFDRNFFDFGVKEIQLLRNDTSKK